MSLEASTREMERAFQNAAAELAVEFREVADEMDKHFKNIRIARITGSSVSALGGVVAFLGLVLAVPTVGVSLIASAAGFSVSVAGAATSGGAQLTGFIIQLVKKKNMEEKWSNFQKRCRQHLGLSPNMAEAVDGISKESQVKEILQQGGTMAVTAGQGVNAAVETGTTAANVAKLASMTTKGATVSKAVVFGVVRGVSKANIVLSLVGVGLSVADIVLASIDLHKKKKCSVGDKLREMADGLDELAGN